MIKQVQSLLMKLEKETQTRLLLVTLLLLEKSVNI